MIIYLQNIICIHNKINILLLTNSNTSNYLEKSIKLKLLLLKIKIKFLVLIIFIISPWNESMIIKWSETVKKVRQWFHQLIMIVTITNIICGIVTVKLNQDITDN